MADNTKRVYNLQEEYWWKNNRWRIVDIVGEVAEENIDLTNYYTRNEADNKFLTKENLDNYYTSEEIDKKLEDIGTGGTVDLSNYYTKDETIYRKVVTPSTSLGEIYVELQSIFKDSNPFCFLEVKSLNKKGYLFFKDNDIIFIDLENTCYYTAQNKNMSIGYLLSSDNLRKQFATLDDIPSLSGYATQSWVEGKKYATEASLSSYVDLSSEQFIIGNKTFSNIAASNLSLQGYYINFGSHTIDFPETNGTVVVVDEQYGGIYTDIAQGEILITSKESALSLASTDMIDSGDAMHKLHFPDTSKNGNEEYNWHLPWCSGDIAVSSDNSFIEVKDINVYGHMLIYSDVGGMENPHTEDDIDTTYFSKGMIIENVDAGTINELYYPMEKTGTIALVEDFRKEISWTDLVDLRNNAKLVPGCEYRIINYTTTTSQYDTQSAGHQFDIIVKADDNRTLNENARAVGHKGDGYFKDTFYLINQIYKIADNDSFYNVGEEKDYGACTVTQFGQRENSNGELSAAMYNPDPDELGNDMWYVNLRRTYEITKNNYINILYSVSEGEGGYIQEEGTLTEDEELRFEIDDIVSIGYKDGTPMFVKNEKWLSIVGYEPDYADEIVYDGKYVLDGKTYDKWKKYEPDFNGQYYYYLTNEVIGEDGKFTIEVDDYENYLDKKYYDIWEEQYVNDSNHDFMQHITEAIVVDGQVDTSKLTKETVGGCNLAAWELKYCLDNDETKFVWADSSGTGVIYYMKDEWGNEAPYDFKNIQFKRYRIIESTKNDSFTDTMLGIRTYSDITVNPEDYEYFYTFSYWYTSGDVVDASIAGNNGTLLNDEGACGGVYRNIIKDNKPTETGRLLLNNIVFIGNEDYDSGNYYGCYGNIFEIGCSDFSFLDGCLNNIFGSNSWNNLFLCDCRNNSFKDNCRGNIFGSNYHYNSAGYNFSSNSLKGESWNNIFGNNFMSNSLDPVCSDNIFGNDCQGNILSENCCYNSFGNDCGGNEFEENCSNNSFGNNCTHNSIGYSKNNIFDNGCSYIKINVHNANNIHVHSGVSGAYGNILILTPIAQADYSQDYISRDSITYQV